jgi:hypothetical protein
LKRYLSDIPDTFIVEGVDRGLRVSDPGQPGSGWNFWNDGNEEHPTTRVTLTEGEWVDVSCSKCGAVLDRGISRSTAFNRSSLYLRHKC